ncbi:MAG: hypothetical protein DRJ63_01155 [Thermoprotei archaeon]|nr:MAG: hypothetical protein DRJ63_01155 [Thermoprotei archaeon]
MSKKKKVGRFQVMALLQAARFYVLTGDLKRAKSFGLNRAIFYAWAKYYGRFVPRRKEVRKGEEVVTVKEGGKYMAYVGNEGAFVTKDGWFIIGDKEQRPEDYEREIASKINSVIPYDEAWRVAVEYVKQFSKSVLLDQQKFYEKVYKPVRDSFAELVERYRKSKKSTLEEFFG